MNQSSHLNGLGPEAADTDEIVTQVKERYGKIAEGRVSGCCASQEWTPCGSPTVSASTGLGYSPEELKAVPVEANLGLGCGVPIDFLELRAGEAVLDLGSGPGLDAFLAARKVGPHGRVIGVDMTPAMLERARQSAAKIGLTQVEFREGRLEALPVEDASVDAVTSNCVINLVPDKRSVFREVARVLRAGGRMVISDIILNGRLPETVEKDLLAYMGCVAGAIQRKAYFAMVEEAGLSAIAVLKDVDYLAGIGESLPADVRALLDRTGARLDELAGKVRSVTFRAVKPALEIAATR